MLLDTDVLLDVALGREPHVDAASRLLDRLQRGPESAFIAWHSASNFYYLVAPVRGGAETRAFLADLLRFTAVAPTSTDALRYAAGLPLKDFEDAMQVAAARACGAEHVVTRNLKDFERSPIPAITPEAALRELF
jgi:predicted nucleic acid-binding protein